MNEKAALLCKETATVVGQRRQLQNPDMRVTLDESRGETLLGNKARGLQGLSPADASRYSRGYWELPTNLAEWCYWQSTPRVTDHYGGREFVLHYGQELRRAFDVGTAYLRGTVAWGSNGVVLKQMGELPCSLYTGNKFDTNCAVVLPKDDSYLSSIWCFCSSSNYSEAVRNIDQKLNVTNATLVQVPFDLSHWRQVAARRYPNGLPKPYSDDPTQWIFHGHPCGSVVWDEERKRTTHGSIRIDATVLQVAVARLLGYRWPAEQDPDMRLADEMRTRVDRCRKLDKFADADGIVCLAPVSGESAAADRLRLLLAAAYKDGWSAATEQQLLAAAAAKRPAESIEEWLRDRFFEEHCRLFHQRPFIWHVWDGRRDGFHALVNYHRLAGPNGEGRRTFEALTYRHLGDWLARQKADRDHGVEGADGRLAAAQDLQNQLVKIMASEPPCDLFVRWKPLGEQPIGWEPDVNDGVRINIRPFMSAELTRGGRAGAGVLRAKPKIGWSKDRGKEALKPRKRWRPPWLDEDNDQDADVDEDQELRPRQHYPWFWGCPGDGLRAERTDFAGGPDFDGNRWNDLHYTNAVKNSALSRTESDAYVRAQRLRVRGPENG